MTQSKVWGYEKKESAQAQKDSVATGFPLSADEAAVLQMAAAGDPTCHEHGSRHILGAVIERNPRTDSRWARDDARRLKDIVGSDWELLDAADQAVLSRASRARDITRAQIKEIEERFFERRHEAAVTKALLNPDAWSRAMRHPPARSASGAPRSTANCAAPGPITSRHDSRRRPGSGQSPLPRKDWRGFSYVMVIARLTASSSLRQARAAQAVEEEPGHPGMPIGVDVPRALDGAAGLSPDKLRRLRPGLLVAAQMG